MGKSKKHMNWQDMYYNGQLDDEDDFCEETQKRVKRRKISGWDEIEDWYDDDDEDYWGNEE